MVDSVASGDNGQVTNDETTAPQPQTAPEEPELFPGERELAKTQPGSREEMRVMRRHYNWVNMVIALAACMALVLAALMFAPRPKGTEVRDIDYREVAASAQQRAEFPLVVPDLSEEWKANAASFDPQGSPAVDTWYISLVGPDDAWVAVNQSAGDERWAESFVDEMAQVGTQDVDGVEFTTWEGDKGLQAMVGPGPEGTETVYLGRAPWDVFAEVASAAAESVG